MSETFPGAGHSLAAGSGGLDLVGGAFWSSRSRECLDKARIVCAKRILVRRG
jgi:hypothetical protein